MTAPFFEFGENYFGTTSENMITEYNTVTKAKNFLKGVPATEIGNDFIPTIKEEDIKRGYIKRYFTRQTNHSNDGEIIEISKTHYEKLQNIPLFVAVEISWKISGKMEDVFSDRVDNLPERLYTGVVSANKMMINEGDKILPGLSKKLSNIKQFYRGD